MALTDFVIRLGTDAALLRHFNNNPDAAMEDAGLSDDERRILRDRDGRQIIDVISTPRSAGPTMAGVTGVITAIGVDDDR